MVRVICADVSSLDEVAYQDLYEKASPERRLRADRYRKREDALRCVMADALLRHALGTPTYSVSTAKNGKPFLPERPEFHYNLSHSGNWVVLAFGGSEVGVDVEQIRPEHRMEAVARRYFTLEEQKYILGDPDRTGRRFCEIWTGKESYLKFLGTGLKTKLDSFGIFSMPDGIRLHHHWLDESHCVCVCTAEAACSFSVMEKDFWKSGEIG